MKEEEALNVLRERHKENKEIENDRINRNRRFEEIKS